MAFDLRITPLEDLEHDWTRLAEASGNVFSSWHWAELWWRNNAAGRQQLVTTAWQGGQLVAIVPLYRFARVPTRVLRLIGHGPADLLQPLVDPSAQLDPAQLLAAALGHHRGGLLFAEELPHFDTWPDVPGASLHRAAATPTLDVSAIADWEAYLATLSTRMRANLRASERGALKRGATYRLCNDPERLPADLDSLFRLHLNNFTTAQSRTFAGMQPFHRAFAARALELGWLRLWLLENDTGRAVGAWYGFRFAGVDSFYQTGRDPEWAKLGVGNVLIAHTIREAIADADVKTYSFGRGDVGYKNRYATTPVPFESMLIASTPMARTAVAAARVVRRSATLKRLLRSPLQG